MSPSRRIPSPANRRLIGEATPIGAQFAPVAPSFDMELLRPDDVRDPLSVMISKLGSEYIGARAFTELFGRAGNAISEAENIATANHFVAAALNPATIKKLILIDRTGAQRTGERLELNKKYGKGVATQFINFLQTHPDQLKAGCLNFGSCFLELADPKDTNVHYKDPKDKEARQRIVSGILERLDYASGLSNHKIRHIAQSLQASVMPQLSFRNYILNHDLESAEDRILLMEKHLIRNRLRIGTAQSFEVLAFDFLTRAVEFQSQRPNFPQAKGMNDVCRLVKSSRNPPVFNLDLLFRLVNGLQEAPECGLQAFNLSQLERDVPQALPLAVDRIMNVATGQGGEVASDRPTKIVRVLGHAARMFAEQGDRHTGSEGSLPLELKDINVRYPELTGDQCKLLIGLIARSTPSRLVHYKARTFSELPAR